jgi:uncharacterized protein
MNEILNSIRYPFAIDKTRGVLMEEIDFGNHVRQMILQVLFTNPGERINRPDFGCGIRSMVFAPNSDATASLLQIMVVQSLDKWLGDVIITERVEVNSINEKLEVKILYTLKAKQERQFLIVQF